MIKPMSAIKYGLPTLLLAATTTAGVMSMNNDIKDKQENVITNPIENTSGTTKALGLLTAAELLGLVAIRRKNDNVDEQFIEGKTIFQKSLMFGRDMESVEYFMKCFELLDKYKTSSNNRIDVALCEFVNDAMVNIPKEADKEADKVMSHIPIKRMTKALEQFKDKNGLINKDAAEYYEYTVSTNHFENEYFNLRDRKKHIIKADDVWKWYNADGSVTPLGLVEDRPVDSKTMWEPTVRVHCAGQYKPAVFYLKDGKAVKVEYTDDGKLGKIGIEIVKNSNSQENISIYFDTVTEKPKMIKLSKDDRHVTITCNSNFQKNNNTTNTKKAGFEYEMMTNIDDTQIKEEREQKRLKAELEKEWQSKKLVNELLTSFG